LSAFALRRFSTESPTKKKEIGKKNIKAGPDRTKNVFVGNLTPSTTRGLLVSHMLSSGLRPTNAKILHKSDGTSKCCGVVTFESAKDALRAIHSLHGTSIDGRNILVKVDEPESERGYYKTTTSSQNFDTNTSIFVTNISFHVTENQLRELFSDVGEIQSLKYYVSPAGQPRGRAMLKFHDKSCAADAILRFDGQVFERRRIYVRYCNPL
jgi:RNA recognition motif-containing protein